MIPLMDLQAQYRAIKPEIDAAVLAVLDSAQYILGPEVQAFEKEFASFQGGGECVGTNSGTSALHLAFLATGIGPGDEVITTAMTFIATASAISYSGARPVFVDIDRITWNIDPGRIEAAITPKTKAIVPVHLHGRMCDMEPILEIARRHNLFVIEDAAQAHGAEYRGARAGAFGDVACFSFYAGKNLGAAGEGGAAISRDAELLKRMRVLRDWGAEQKYVHTLRGYNYRLEGMQGAILRVKLRHLEDWTDKRIAHASHYDKALDAIGISRPASPLSVDRHVYHIYAVRVPERDRVREALAAAKIGAGMHYPIPVHLQPTFADLGYRRGDFPQAEKLAAETMSLPLYAEMTDTQRETVVTVLRNLTT